MFFLFSLFFIFFFIYLLFGCSMFGFLPTSERGQETPTFWPLLPCPEEFEEVGEEWMVGRNRRKNKRKGGRRKEGEREGSTQWYCLDSSPLDTSDSFFWHLFCRFGIHSLCILWYFSLSLLWVIVLMRTNSQTIWDYLWKYSSSLTSCIRRCLFYNF